MTKEFSSLDDYATQPPATASLASASTFASADQAIELSAEQSANSAAEHSRDDNKSPTLIEKFVIRLPNGLRDQIRQLSEQNRRSMNSEIIMVLESHIRQQFMEHMASANADGGDFVPGQRKTEAELNRMLESLPAQKKEALLELLG